jgi:hypothetical protein
MSDALLRTEESNRLGWVYDKAQDMRSDGARQARRASGLGRQQVDNELDTCAAYLGAPQTTAVASQ